MLLNLFSRNDINRALEAYDAEPDGLLLDVRTEEEFSQGRIPGSKNVPLGSIDKVRDIADNKDIPLFVYCYSGARSRRAAAMLMQMGYTQVKNLGGIAAYKGRMER